MKRIYMLVLVFILVFGLSACDKDDKDIDLVYSLRGTENVVYNLGDTLPNFSDLITAASYNSNVVITNFDDSLVDYTVLGDYDVVVSLTVDDVETSETFILHVVDNELPNIMLTNNMFSIEASLEDIRSEVIVTDNSGSLKLIQLNTVDIDFGIEGDYFLEVTAVDGSGNEITIVFDIEIKDINSPTVNGRRDYYIYVNDSPIDFDTIISFSDIDGTIVQSSIIENINYSVPGLYEVVFIAEDNDGKVTTELNYVFIKYPNQEIKDYTPFYIVPNDSEEEIITAYNELMNIALQVINDYIYEVEIDSLIYSYPQFEKMLRRSLTDYDKAIIDGYRELLIRNTKLFFGDTLGREISDYEAIMIDTYYSIAFEYLSNQDYIVRGYYGIFQGFLDISYLTNFEIQIGIDRDLDFKEINALDFYRLFNDYNIIHHNYKNIIEKTSYNPNLLVKDYFEEKLVFQDFLNTRGIYLELAAYSIDFIEEAIDRELSEFEELCVEEYYNYEQYSFVYSLIYEYKITEDTEIENIENAVNILFDILQENNTYYSYNRFMYRDITIEEILLNNTLSPLQIEALEFIDDLLQRNHTIFFDIIYPDLISNLSNQEDIDKVLMVREILIETNSLNESAILHSYSYYETLLNRTLTIEEKAAFDFVYDNLYLDIDPMYVYLYDEETLRSISSIDILDLDYFNLYIYHKYTHFQDLPSEELKNKVVTHIAHAELAKYLEDKRFLDIAVTDAFFGVVEEILDIPSANDLLREIVRNRYSTFELEISYGITFSNEQTAAIDLLHSELNKYSFSSKVEFYKLFRYGEYTNDPLLFDAYEILIVNLPRESFERAFRIGYKGMIKEYDIDGSSELEASFNYVRDMYYLHSLEEYLYLSGKYIDVSSLNQEKTLIALRTINEEYLNEFDYVYSMGYDRIEYYFEGKFSEVEIDAITYLFSEINYYMLANLYADVTESYYFVNEDIDSDKISEGIELIRTYSIHFIEPEISDLNTSILSYVENPTSQEIEVANYLQEIIDMMFELETVYSILSYVDPEIITSDDVRGFLEILSENGYETGADSILEDIITEEEYYLLIDSLSSNDKAGVSLIYETYSFNNLISRIPFNINRNILDNVIAIDILREGRDLYHSVSCQLCTYEEFMSEYGNDFSEEELEYITVYSMTKDNLTNDYNYFDNTYYLIARVIYSKEVTSIEDLNVFVDILDLVEVYGKHTVMVGIYSGYERAEEEYNDTFDDDTREFLDNLYFKYRFEDLLYDIYKIGVELTDDEIEVLWLLSEKIKSEYNIQELLDGIGYDGIPISENAEFEFTAIELELLDRILIANIKWDIYRFKFFEGATPEEIADEVNLWLLFEETEPDFSKKCEWTIIMTENYLGRELTTEELLWLENHNRRVAITLLIEEIREIEYYDGNFFSPSEREILTSLYDLRYELIELNLTLIEFNDVSNNETLLGRALTTEEEAALILLFGE